MQHSMLSTIDEPQTFEKAMASDIVEEWKQTMREEIESLRTNNIWVLETLSLNNIRKQTSHRL